ncbi:hypothetical protein QJQ45_030329 [Haematococcus lacustris]|nr:hypothetical protein QJQ45_030329 [Haematococcus lacustris]
MRGSERGHQGKSPARTHHYSRCVYVYVTPDWGLLWRCLVQIVKAHPSVVKHGEVTLQCNDGGLSVLRAVFVVSSPWMADMLGKGFTTVEVSGSTKEEWLLVISQLYPIVPHPELSLQQLQQMLPVVHKYNFPELLQFVGSRLATELPKSWSLDPSAPGYIIKWLVTAEQLQLDALKQAALEGLSKQRRQQDRMLMKSDMLDADLLRLSPGLMLEPLRGLRPWLWDWLW